MCSGCKVTNRDVKQQSDGLAEQLKPVCEVACLVAVLRLNTVGCQLATAAAVHHPGQHWSSISQAFGWLCS